MSRRLVSSGGPWEAKAAYSRAVAVGNQCFVAGTTDAGPDGRSHHPDDIAAQAAAVFGIIERALDEAGFALADVVRIRMFVTDITQAPQIMVVSGRVFGEIRPAATMIEVAALIDPSLLIEIEADALRSPADQG